MITPRNITLFIHLLGVVTLFIAFGILQRAGARARAAKTVEELRQWLGFAQTTRPMFTSATAMILLSGLYLAYLARAFSTAWVSVAMASVVFQTILGAVVAGRGFAAMGRAAGNATGSIPPELAQVIARPTAWIASGASNGMAIGLLWLMVLRPGWAHSIAVVTALGLVGAGLGARAARSRASQESRHDHRAAAVARPGR